MTDAAQAKSPTPGNPDREDPEFFSSNFLSSPAKIPLVTTSKIQNTVKKSSAIERTGSVVLQKASAQKGKNRLSPLIQQFLANRFPWNRLFRHIAQKIKTD